MFLHYKAILYLHACTSQTARDEFYICMPRYRIVGKNIHYTCMVALYVFSNDSICRPNVWKRIARKWASVRTPLTVKLCNKHNAHYAGT